MRLLCVCLAVLCLAGPSLARYVPDAANEDYDMSTAIRCSCTITAQMYDDSPYHNFGVIQTFHPDDSSDQCHHIRHQCRKECALRSDLGADVEVHQPLGRQLCRKLGIRTVGIPKVFSHASLEGPDTSPCVGRHSQWSDRYLDKQESQHVLCCANSVGENGEKKLGWNPDCKGRNYVWV